MVLILAPLHDFCPCITDFLMHFCNPLDSTTSVSQNFPPEFGQAVDTPLLHTYTYTQIDALASTPPRSAALIAIGGGLALLAPLPTPAPPGLQQAPADSRPRLSERRASRHQSGSSRPHLDRGGRRRPRPPRKPGPARPAPTPPGSAWLRLAARHCAPSGPLTRPRPHSNRTPHATYHTHSTPHLDADDARAAASQWTAWVRGLPDRERVRVASVWSWYQDATLQNSDGAYISPGVFPST